MLAREVGADDLRTDIGGSAVDLDPFPAAVPARIGEEALQRLGIEIALAGEVPVEAAMGQAGFRHDPPDRHAVETVPVEQSAGRADDGRFGRVAMVGPVRHELLRRARASWSRPEDDVDHLVGACSFATRTLARMGRTECQTRYGKR